MGYSRFTKKSIKDDNKNPDLKPIEGLKSDGLIGEREIITQKPKIDIEDVLTQPLDQKEITPSKSTEEFNKEKAKLQEIFKGQDISQHIYQTTTDGDIIVGEESFEILHPDGTTSIKTRPVVQKRLNELDEDSMIAIEVPLMSEEERRAKDELGLTSAERHRYDKLVSLNKAQGIPINQKYLIQKAKNVRDLDATMMPDMMMHFVTSDEDHMIELTEKDRDTIKDLRKKGVLFKPSTIAGIDKSIRLAAEYQAVHVRDMFVYLTHKGFNIERDSMDALDTAIRMYKDERRPSLDLLIQAVNNDMAQVMYTKLREMAKQDEGYDSNMANAVEEQIKHFQLDIKHRDNLIALYEEKGEHFFDIKDFKKMDVYFRFWGIHDDDIKHFNPNYVSDPKRGVPMSQRFKEFKQHTGWDFIEVYGYYKKRAEELLEEDIKYKKELEDNPEGVNHEVEIESDDTDNSIVDLDDFDFI